MRAGWPSMCAFGLRTARTLRGGAGYSSQTAPPLAPSCSCGGKEPFRQVGVGRADVKRSIDGSGPIQQFQSTRLQPAGDRNAMFAKFPPAVVWVSPPGPRRASARPAAPPTSSIPSAAASNRLCRILRFASAISGSTESRTRETCVVIGLLSVAPPPSVKPAISGSFRNPGPPRPRLHPSKAALLDWRWNLGAPPRGRRPQPRHEAGAEPRRPALAGQPVRDLKEPDGGVEERT
jgi:hypothetical protein